LNSLLFGWQFEIVAGQRTGCRKEASLIRSAVLFVTKMVRIYIQHILTSCVFARQFWFAVLQSLNLTHLTPSSSSVSFADWWRRSWKKLQKQHRKGFNSLCILGAWILWKHRNACVFDGMSPNLQQALQAFKDESLIWRFSGAKGLAALDPGRMVKQV